jgi:hypothetical protein
MFSGEAKENTREMVCSCEIFPEVMKKVIGGEFASGANFFFIDSDLPCPSGHRLAVLNSGTHRDWQKVE